jgi:hypothetical protein
VAAHAATRKIACAAFAIAALSAAAGVGLTTSAAAASAVRAAPAATAGFPAPGLPFAIQETLSGRTLCLTRPATVKLATAPEFPVVQPARPEPGTAVVPQQRRRQRLWSSHRQQQ